MTILIIAGHFAYFAFLTWLILATFVNYILKPINAIARKSVYTISRGITAAYVTLWAVALTIPVAYTLIAG